MDLPFKDLFKDLSFLKKPDNVAGIDIGSSSIKIVQLRKEKERAILETYGEIALGPYGNMEVGQSVKLPDEKIIEALKDLKKEANVSAKTAVVSIPLKSSFITLINIPVVDGKNFAEIVQLEARRYIPVAISEVEIDWWVLPESLEEKLVTDASTKQNEEEDKNQKKIKFNRVLLVAIHKDEISKYQKIVANAGFEITGMEIESFSMTRSCLKRETSPSVIMDFGSLSTKIAIVDYGVIMQTHSVPKGSQDITMAISHSMGVDFGRAEEMKREIGLSDLPEHKETREIIEPILEFILAEASSVINGFQRKYNKAVTKVILSGGGSLMKGLSDLVVKRLGIEVIMADPFAKTEYPAFLEGALKEIGPNFSVSVGLSLRGLSD